VKPAWLQYGYSVEARGQTPALFEQTHGSNAISIDEQALRAERSNLPQADAGFTRAAGREVFVFAADCLPVFLYGQTAQDPIAAIHAGWKGALAGIVRATLKSWNHPATQTTAVLGPCIGPCCFEIRDDFRQAFLAQAKPVDEYVEKRGGRLYFDLAEYVACEELVGVSGIMQDARRCTFCSAPVLPSYRRNGKADPRIRAWIRKSV